MKTLEGLAKRIRTAQELLSVVKTMKSLAAANIRIYERAASSVELYGEVVDRGWQVFFRETGFRLKEVRAADAGACLVVGSDQGMCGPFNEKVQEMARREMDRLTESGMDLRLWTCGDRVLRALQDAGWTEAERLEAPRGLSGINEAVLDAIHRIDHGRAVNGLGTLFLCHNVPVRGAYAPVFRRVLPLDRAWGRLHTAARWPSRCLPVLGLPQEEMFQHLFRQHLYVSLYRAFAQSLAGENAARFMAMQAAEKNIGEIQEDLTALFREERQSEITSELLDIVSGFEVLREDRFVG